LIPVDQNRTYSLSCFTLMLNRTVTFHNRISSYTKLEQHTKRGLGPGYIQRHAG